MAMCSCGQSVALVYQVLIEYDCPEPGTPTRELTQYCESCLSTLLFTPGWAKATSGITLIELRFMEADRGVLAEACK